MKFTEIIEQTTVLLQQKRRVAYRTLQREFGLDEEALEDLKLELIDVQEVAVDKDGKMLVWSGDRPDPPVPIPQAQPSASPPVQRAVPEGDRRQLTVMFCDLVGSTALSEQLDPEDLHAVVRTYQAACRKVIERYDGYIAQYLGDGILVYFGYPAAHEDDAIRGVRAGLEILAALPTLELAHPIQARIGLHTGPVVIGAVGGGEHTEQLALGETPNIAARVQGKAEPHTVAISADTYRLVQGFFACTDLGPQELKGLSSPLTLYEVTGEGEAQNRFDVSVQQGLTPLIGREEEVELLVRRWERAKAGQGQVVLLSGEAGIGKSRLVQVLRDHSRNDNPFRAVFRCATFYQNSALYPGIDRLQKFLQLKTDDTPAEKLGKLTHALEPVRLTDPETIALLAGHLSIPLPDDHPPLQLSPQKQKEKTIQALVRWLQNAAQHQPVLVEFEDLHWADPSTLEFLGLLIDAVPSARMLVLLTFRPEFTPPWPGHAHMLALQLNRLPQQEIAAMVERVAGKALPEEVVQQLLAKSDGVPLYIEEMTKNLVESGLLTETDGQYELTGPLPEMAIPSSLQDSFAARLDRLASVRELAQIGAVLGREFSYGLIHAVSRVDDPKLQNGLGQLSAADILFQRGLPPDATYSFKHALLQDAAYASLLKSQRQQFHAQTAAVLEQQFPETVDIHPELVAHHYTEASRPEQAIPYWQQAGERAMQRSANQEAIGHLTQGIEVLQTLPDTPERSQHELALQSALGPALMVTKGWSAPAVKAVYNRQEELCQKMGETPQLFRVWHGLWTSYFMRSEHRAGLELGERLLRLAQIAGDPALRLEAHVALMHTLWTMGELGQAQEHCEQGNALYDQAQHHALTFVYFGFDPGMGCLVMLGYVLHYQGYPDQARQRMTAAVVLAREVAHPASLAHALMNSALLYYFRGEGQLAQEAITEQIALTTEQGLALYLAWGTMIQGLLLGARGQDEEGLAQIRTGLAAYRATGGEYDMPTWLAGLAEAQARVGHVEAGLSVLAEALAAGQRTGEEKNEAELYRLKGELLLQQSPDHAAEAEISFQHARTIAHHQQAKSWELRAATSLARLWQGQGKKNEARNLLAPVYGWFTEGFDTADLKDAKALLNELSEER